MSLNKAQKALVQLKALHKEFLGQMTLLKKKQQDILKQYNKELEKEKLKLIRSKMN